MDIQVTTPTVKIPETPLLRYHQREELQQEVESMEEQLDPANKWKLTRESDVSEVRSRTRRLKKQLQDQVPAELTGAQKDLLLKEIKAIEDRVLPGMPTQEEMRKNPAGMVGKHMRWEKTHKRDILRWKNAMQMLEPDNNDPDVSNFERLRPSGEMDRLRTDAQISGHLNYRSVPQQNWDQVFAPPQNTALEQAKRVEQERKTMTDEQKQAARDRLILARQRLAEKRAAEAKTAPVEGEPVVHQEA